MLYWQQPSRKKPPDRGPKIVSIHSMSSVESTPVGLQPDGQVISRCGLICNTCTAYTTGACPGCHQLAAGECVIRDCADLKGTSCLDCQAPSCYHFEAYALRRQMMNAKAQRYYRLLNSSPGGSQRAAACGCRSGRASAGAGCGSGCGGCAAASGGCPATRAVAALLSATSTAP